MLWEDAQGDADGKGVHASFYKMRERGQAGEIFVKLTFHLKDCP